MSTHAQLQREGYNKRAEEAASDSIHNRRIQEFISEICTKGRKRILDVGCGDGRITRHFVEGNKCYGVDISEKAVHKAMERGLKGYVLDLEEDSFPFQDGYFDLVICSQVIEHIINTDHILTEINRILHKNGFMILSFPNINQPLSWLLQILLDYPPVYSSRYKSWHMRDFTLRLMKTALRLNGFTVIRVEGSFIFPFRNRFSRYFSRIFPRFAEKIIIVAKKMAEPKATSRVVCDVREL